VEGLQQVAVDPAIAALLGANTVQRTFYRKDIFPQWDVSLSRQFHRANVSFAYDSGATPGNGVYLTSRQTSGTVGFSYSATRKWSLSGSAGYSNLQGIGQGLQPFAQFTGGAGATYAISRLFQAFTRYDARHQEIVNGSYLQNSYRATIGVSFSPSDVPLSFH
jgi:hypothetical protein